MNGKKAKKARKIAAQLSDIMQANTPEQQRRVYKITKKRLGVVHVPRI